MTIMKTLSRTTKRLLGAAALSSVLASASTQTADAQVTLSADANSAWVFRGLAFGSNPVGSVSVTIGDNKSATATTYVTKQGISASLVSISAQAHRKEYSAKGTLLGIDLGHGDKTAETSLLLSRTGAMPLQLECVKDWSVNRGGRCALGATLATPLGTTVNLEIGRNQNYYTDGSRGDLSVLISKSFGGTLSPTAQAGYVLSPRGQRQFYVGGSVKLVRQR